MVEARCWMLVVSVDDFFETVAVENLRNLGWSSEKIGPISIDEFETTKGFLQC